METEKAARKPSGGGEGEPCVSVIIPVYNRPALVKDAVSSVLFQSHPGLECILVDDGSEEPPEETLELFSKDPRFRPLRIDHCGMPGAVRNRGVEAARCDLIAFLDSDDLWLPRKLEKQLELMESGQTVLIHSREIWLRGTKIVSQKSQRHRRRGDVFADALRKCMIGPSTVMMSRRIFREAGGFREDMEIAEDYEFWLRLTAIFPVEYTDEPLVVKRAGHGGQLSEKYGQIEIFRLRALQRLVEEGFFDRPREMPKERGVLAAAELSRKCAIYSAGCRARGREEEAERYEGLAEEYRVSG
jgi:glycosyltransferase involved in cell wall biosynthesis